MSPTTTTGEHPFVGWCPECNPDAFNDDPRPKVLLPLCEHHLAQVRVPSEEELRAAMEEGARQRRAVEEAERYLIHSDPRIRFR